MGEWIAAAGAAIYGALSSAAAGASAAVGSAATAVGSAASSAAGLGGLTAATAEVGALTGSMAGAGAIGGGAATTAAATGATLGGTLLKAAIPAALSTGASMLTPKPEMPGAPPPVTPYGKDSLPKKIAEPSAPPTEGVASSNAFKAEERRRLLAGMPQATQNIFSSPGGDQSRAQLRKPRLLGGGVGQTTTGV